MELSGPGVQYIADNQLYNSIITAHALLMSTPFHLGLALLFAITIHISWYVKSNRAGGVKLRGETLTVKSILKELFIYSHRDLDDNSDLSSVTFRLTNLIRRVVYHNGIIVEGWTRTVALVDSILSLVLNLLISNGTCQGEARFLRKKPITNCADKGIRDYLRGKTYGNGIIVVREFWSLERVTTNRKLIRKFSSKAGENTLRGCEKPNQWVKSNISIKDISNFKNLVAAFELIKSNPGNITKGVTQETLNVINLDYLLTRRLQDGKFKLGLARRIQIPGENTTRPLTMAYLRESLVQKAVQLVLELVHVENFRNYSLIPGTKTAIQFLEFNFHSYKYILEADFHNPSHNKLIDLLKTRIKCEKFISLICSGLEAGYVEQGQLHERSGIPQVSILSPLLSNVYLDEYAILKEDSQSKTCRNMKEYESWVNKMKYWLNKDEDPLISVEFITIKRKLLSTSSMRHDPSFCKVVYVRYADSSFVIGSFSIATEILDRVNDFVTNELSLTLNPVKFGIVYDSLKKPLKFLSYNIMKPKGSRDAIKLKGRLISRRKKTRTVINMDRSKVITTLKNLGLIRKRVSHSDHQNLIFRGTFIGNLLNLDHADIIQYYNSIIIDIYNYYVFVGNRCKIFWVYGLIKESCALTLARKFKVRTLRKIFRKFGSDLTSSVIGKNGATYTRSLISSKDLKPGWLAIRRQDVKLSNLDKKRQIH
jgi:hypothetical protein